MILEVDVDFTLSWPLIVQAVVATVLPLLVGLVTKKTTRSGVKALLLAGLAVVTSGLTELGESMVAGEVFGFGLWLTGAITTFALAVGFHLGLWRPVGATAAVQAVGDKANPPERAAEG